MKKRLTCVTLWLGMAMGLPAQQLSFGALALGAGQTKTMTVVLASQGTQVAGLQFDLAYNTSALAVTIALGSSATAAGKELSLNSLASPATGQRVVICGAGLADPSVAATAGNLIADGVVATLTIAKAAGATSANQSLTLTNVAATTPGALNVSPAAIPITVAGGTVNMYTTYVEGDVAPYSSDTAPSFGDGALNILDLIQELFAVNSVPGFRPAACSDRFDAMDLYPVDAGSTRGGDGLLDIRDLIRELFRVNNLDMDRPVRATRGGVCAGGHAMPASAGLTEASRSPSSLPRPRADVQGVLVLGAPEKTAEAEERVPVYLEARNGLVRVAVTFALGDQRSRLRFAPTAETPPSLAQDSQLGVVAVAWFAGVNVRAGERLLLGYVAGPTGASANLRVYGTSASGLDDNREVRLDAPTTAGLR